MRSTKQATSDLIQHNVEGTFVVNIFTKTLKYPLQTF